MRRNSLGNLFSQMSQPDKALKAFEDALELSRKLAEEFPAVPAYRLDVAQQLNNSALVLLATGKKDLARSQSREALGLCRKLVADHPDTPIYQLNLGGILRHLGVIVRDDGDLVESRRLLEEAVAHQLDAWKRSPRRRLNLLLLRDSYAESAETLLGLHEREQAAKIALRYRSCCRNGRNTCVPRTSWPGAGRWPLRTVLCRGVRPRPRRVPTVPKPSTSWTRRSSSSRRRANLWMERAVHHASLERWNEAAADYAKAWELLPDDLDLLASYAPVLLLAGQPESVSGPLPKGPRRFRRRTIGKPTCWRGFAP